MITIVIVMIVMIVMRVITISEYDYVDSVNDGCDYDDDGLNVIIFSTFSSRIRDVQYVLNHGQIQAHID